MKLSTKGRYGLRALIDLALYSENETVSIASISARQNISESYLEQLIAKLRKAGLVTSVRGAGGGYKLGAGGKPGRGEMPGTGGGKLLRRLRVLRDQVRLAED